MNASNEVIPKDKYKTSRVMYILWAAFEYFISICTSGAYLAKLTSSIGITDSMTALISTLASLAGSFQVIAILLAHKTPVKRWVVPIQFVFQAMLASLFLIPFLNFGPHAGIVVFVIFLVANALKNIALPVKSAWFINLTDPKTRGLFQSILNIVSLIGGMAFTLFISRVIDSYEARGDIKGAFLVLTVIIFICTVLDIIVLLISKEKPTEIKDHVSPLGEVKNLLYRSRALEPHLIDNVILSRNVSDQGAWFQYDLYFYADCSYQFSYYDLHLFLRKILGPPRISSSFESRLYLKLLSLCYSNIHNTRKRKIYVHNLRHDQSSRLFRYNHR